MSLVSCLFLPRVSQPRTSHLAPHTSRLASLLAPRATYRSCASQGAPPLVSFLLPLLIPSNPSFLASLLFNKIISSLLASLTPHSSFTLHTSRLAPRTPILASCLSSLLVSCLFSLSSYLVPVSPTPQTSNLTPHTKQLIPHIPHLAPHTSHLTHHTSHLSFSIHT